VEELQFIGEQHTFFFLFVTDAMMDRIKQQ
jgi:hypothetical protein